MKYRILLIFSLILLITGCNATNKNLLVNNDIISVNTPNYIQIKSELDIIGIFSNKNKKYEKIVFSNNTYLKGENYFLYKKNLEKNPFSKNYIENKLSNIKSDWKWSVKTNSYKNDYGYMSYATAENKNMKCTFAWQHIYFDKNNTYIEYRYCGKDFKFIDFSLNGLLDK